MKERESNVSRDERIWSDFQKNYKSKWGSSVKARFKELSSHDIEKLDGSRESLELMLREKLHKSPEQATQEAKSFGDEVVWPAIDTTSLEKH